MLDARIAHSTEIVLLQSLKKAHEVVAGILDSTTRIEAVLFDKWQVACRILDWIAIIEERCGCADDRFETS